MNVFGDQIDPQSIVNFFCGTTTGARNRSIDQSHVSAYLHGASEQLEGQIAPAKITMARLASHQL